MVWGRFNDSQRLASEDADGLDSSTSRPRKVRLGGRAPELPPRQAHLTRSAAASENLLYAEGQAGATHNTREHESKTSTGQQQPLLFEPKHQYIAILHQLFHRLRPRTGRNKTIYPENQNRNLTTLDQKRVGGGICVDLVPLPSGAWLFLQCGLARGMTPIRRSRYTSHHVLSQVLRSWRVSLPFSRLSPDCLVVGVGARAHVGTHVGGHARRTHGGPHGRRVILRPASHDGPAAATTEVLPAEGREPLLLGDGVDVSADDEGDEVEEGDPEVVGEELLRKGKADRRRDPADLHDPPEANPDSGLHLVECLRTSDQGHGNQVHTVLDRRELRHSLVCPQILGTGAVRDGLR